MLYTALITGLPTVRQNDLSDLEHLIQKFTAEVRYVPFPDILNCDCENALIFVIAAAQGSSLQVFFWDPRFLALLSNHRDDARLYDTLLKGCVDFLLWPCRHEEFAARIGRLKKRGDTPQRLNNPSVRERAIKDLGLIGCSDRFISALELTAKFSRYEVPVLLEGETGTGKELFARALHYFGSRNDRPFVPVNCGAIPDTLIENELFGHVSGAYTGARGAMEGLISQANGGTLFFDEVHCLSPKGQATLLRFAQDQTYRPLGASAPPRRADVRLVAATNQCLSKCVLEGRFREDLFYRLKIGYVRLPPLRERKEDIPILIDEFVAKLCTRYRTDPRRLDAASSAWLAAQPWKGNVRELENFVLREFLLSDDPIIRVNPRSSLIDEEAPSAGTNCEISFKDAKGQSLRAFEGGYIRRMLALARGNVTDAARRSGKDRRVFGRLMKKYGIDRKEFTCGNS